MKIKIIIVGGPTATYVSDKSEELIKGQIMAALETKTAWENPNGTLIGHNLLASSIVIFEQEPKAEGD
jgi:hypothetical protein